jgi:hypothetical protein
VKLVVGGSLGVSSRPGEGPLGDAVLFGGEEVEELELAAGKPEALAGGEDLGGLGADLELAGVGTLRGPHAISAEISAARRAR